MIEYDGRYVITDGHKYFRVNSSNQQETTTDFSRARLFDTYDKAYNSISTMKKTLRISTWEIKRASECVKPFHDTDKHIVENTYSPVSNEINLLHKAKEIESFTKEISTQKEQLESKLLIVEREICDIEHAAEFYQLPADKGYKLYRMLREARIERRKCKDGLAQISYILDSNFQDCTESRISKRIEGLNNRTYQPRILKELFSM